MASYSYFIKSGDVVAASAGVAAAGAKLYFYEGTGTTPLVVYQDAGLTTPHQWPVICSADGRIPSIYLALSGTYNVVVKTAADVTLYAIPELAASQEGESSIQSGKRNYAVTAGTSTAYTAVFDPPFIAVDTGTVIYVSPHVANGASPTLDVGIGALPIVNSAGSAIATASLRAGGIVALIKRASSWMIAADPIPGIGYTPVNKDGDTIWGQITLQATTGTTGPRLSSRGSTGYVFDHLSQVSGGVYSGLLQVFGPGGTPSATFKLGANGSLAVPGALSKGSGTFLIEHPLDPTKKLAHGFVEAPRYDLIYRGVAQLVDGRAVVDIDAASNMTPGTFAALTRNAVVAGLQNLDGFARLKPGAFAGASLEILCEDGASTDRVAWLVIAERQDAFVRSGNDPNTDAEGWFIPERPKPPEPDPLPEEAE